MIFDLPGKAARSEIGPYQGNRPARRASSTRTVGPLGDLALPILGTFWIGLELLAAENSLVSKAGYCDQDETRWRIESGTGDAGGCHESAIAECHPASRRHFQNTAFDGIVRNRQCADDVFIGRIQPIIGAEFRRPCATSARAGSSAKRGGVLEQRLRTGGTGRRGVCGDCGK